MIHNVLITSLKGRKKNEEISYYYYNDGTKKVYCNALTSAEAGCKYVLADYKIDTILTFGSESTYDPGDDLHPMLLKEGKSLYLSDIREMSSYGLFRYRLTEYLDEINAEAQDCRELLDNDEQDDAKEFIHEFFKKHVKIDGASRFDRLFDKLASNPELRTFMEEELSKTVQERGSDPEKWQKWIQCYLYEKYIERGKMYLHENNKDVRIQFISSGINDDSGAAFTDLLIKNLLQINQISEYNNNDEVNLYLCLQEDNAIDTFVLTSLTETVRSMPGKRVNVVRIMMAETPSPGGLARIYDDTDKLAVSELLSGTRGFLRYGKTDMLMDFQKRAKIQNPKIDQVLYAMRSIDIGISLCDFTEIERGINNLKSFFSEVQWIEGDSFSEKYFNIVTGSIKQDYGPLLKGEKVEFIDLVKWAYQKEFWQQTLTMIESRAPQEFVDKGIFYYCDSPKRKEDVVSKFGQIYYDLKPYEKYKLEDVSHYFVKFYDRWKVPSSKRGKEYQMEYARTRVRELETNDEKIIKACTMCSDKDILTELLFSYYYLGDVRNATNHAVDETNGFISIMKDSDISERMRLITQTIDYFIYCYEKAIKMMETASPADNIQIDPVEIAEYANMIRRANRTDSRDKK